MKKVLLDCVCAVAEAKNKILVTEVRIILHDVPKNRPIPNGYHGFRNVVCIFPQAHSETATKYDDFHLKYSFVDRKKLNPASTAKTFSRSVPAGGPSLMDVYFGNGHNEFASPLANKSILLDDFVLEVPRKNEQIVGRCFPDALRWKDRNMCARQKPAVLIRIPINRVVQEIRPN